MKNEYYTVRQIAKLLYLKEGTIRNKLSKGESLPPSKKIGSRRLFPIKEFEKWIASQMMRY